MAPVDLMAKLVDEKYYYTMFFIFKIKLKLIVIFCFYIFRFSFVNNCEN
jgi:hypothetical protein